MAYQTITAERSGPAFVITLNRPERRNAVSVRMMDEMVAAALEAERDDGTTGVVITGGRSYFSAGADLNEALRASAVADTLAYAGNWRRLNETLESVGKPVIAAIEGFCLTGGCELALACDIRVAGEGASFAITSARIGTVPGAGATQRLPRIVGMAHALDMLFSAEPIDAERAYRIGLINRKTAAGEALPEALRMCAVYRERAPLSLALIKLAVRRGMEMDLRSAIDFEATLCASAYTTEDRREGITAFLERRAARFRRR